MLHHMLRAAAQRAFSVLDPYFQYVTMLLHGDGTNGAQNNTFLDSSTNNFTITRNGNTTQGTFSPYGANWSNYFDGSGDYLTGTSPNLSGTWTVELWWFPTVFSGNQTIISFNNGAGPGINIWSNSSRQLSVDDGNTGQSAFTTTTFSANTWNHLAVVRNGTTTTGYINGVVAGSNSFTPSTTSAFSIGRFNGGTFQYSTGYISNVRVVNGTAVYTSAFTPPTAPLTAITNTSLLTCQSNRFVDNSTNAYAITKNGDTSVQRFSPFSPTSAYSTSVIGGSGYFDGSGDYLTFATGTAALSSNDFSIEAWVYPTSAISSVTLTSGQSDLATIAGSSWTFNLGSASAAAVYVGSAGDYGITSASPVVNAWNHVVFCRTSGTISTYLNGNRVATRTDLGSSSVNAGSTSNPPSVGASPNGGSGFPGYIAGYRRIIGSGGFSATGTTITVPTTPPTAITNTNLLLSCTNAGILDNAMMNDLETVGNAQISTSVKKYGTGSLAFDGTGDRLISAANPVMDLSVGDFTVECWVYTNTTSGAHSAAMRGATSGITSGSDFQWNIYQNGTSMIVRPYSSSTDYTINVGTITSGVWYHVALVRSGSTFMGFLNGVKSSTTQTISGSLNNNTAWYGVIVGLAALTTGDEAWNGYIDDLRITKGVARYTSNFSVPTAAFPNN